MESEDTVVFSVVCPRAVAVFLVGDFNGWSTFATPLEKTEDHTWQVSMVLPATQDRFGYFVMESALATGTPTVGKTFFVPGNWSNVIRTPCLSWSEFVDSQTVQA